MAASRLSPRMASSSFTSMRMAWKVRLAGCPPVRARRCGDGVADDVGQFGGGGHGPGGDDGPGDATGEALVAEVTQHRRQSCLRVAVDDVGGGDGGVGVHTHVERGRVAIAEAALGPVELGGADAEVEEGPDDGLTGDGRSGDCGERVETGPHGERPFAEGGQALGGGEQRTRVLVDAEELHVVVRLEQGHGVSRPTQRGVDHPSRRHRGEEAHDLVGHHREVGEGALRAGVHGGPGRRTPAAPGPLIGSPSDHGRSPGCLPD